jgi:photosystem II stability/assembly factor-like uncharacterized protein
MKKLFSLRILCLFAVLLVLSTASFGQEGWTIARRTASDDDLNTVYFANSERGWVGGDRGFLAWTSDGGKTWVRQILQTKENVNDVYFRSSERGYALAGADVFSSEDGGRIWRKEKVLRADEFGKGKTSELLSIRFPNKNNGWIVGLISDGDAFVESLVLHSSDGGTTWRRVRVPTKDQLIHLDFTNEENGWIVGANGTILNTDDGGETWREQTSGIKNTLYHVEFRDRKLGWIVGSKGAILRSEDGGRTWRQASSQVNNTLLSVDFVSDKIGWAVGRGGTILRSEDGGKTWLKQDGKTAANLFGLYIEKKRGWAVGGKGVILRYER